MIPVITTFLGYYLVRRWESQKRLLDEKKKVYGELLWSIGKVAQGLNDYRNLQLTKLTNGDSKGLLAQFVKLQSLSSS